MEKGGAAIHEKHTRNPRYPVVMAVWTTPGHSLSGLHRTKGTSYRSPCGVKRLKKHSVRNRRVAVNHPKQGSRGFGKSRRFSRLRIGRVSLPCGL
jgi:hypothetical protein